MNDYVNHGWYESLKIWIIYSLTYNYYMILNHWKSSSQAGIQRYLAIFEKSWNITNYCTPMASSPAISLFPLTLAPSVKWDKPRGLGYFGIGHCPLWAAPLGFVWTDLLFCRAKQALNMVESCNFERWSLPKHPRHPVFPSNGRQNIDVARVMSHQKHFKIFKFWVNNIWVGLPSASWHPHGPPPCEPDAVFGSPRVVQRSSSKAASCGSCHWVDFKIFLDGFLSAGKLAVDDHPNVSMPGRSLSEFQGRLWTVQIIITMGVRRMPQTGHHVICYGGPTASQFQWWRWSKGCEWLWLKIGNLLQKPKVPKVPKVSCLMIMFPFTSMCHPGLGVNLGHSLDPKLQKTWALLVISSSAQHLYSTHGIPPLATAEPEEKLSLSCDGMAHWSFSMHDLEPGQQRENHEKIKNKKTTSFTPLRSSRSACRSVSSTLFLSSCWVLITAAKLKRHHWPLDVDYFADELIGIRCSAREGSLLNRRFVNSTELLIWSLCRTVGPRAMKLPGPLGDFPSSIPTKSSSSWVLGITIPSRHINYSIILWPFFRHIGQHQQKVLPHGHIQLLHCQDRPTPPLAWPAQPQPAGKRQRRARRKVVLRCLPGGLRVPVTGGREVIIVD